MVARIDEERNHPTADDAGGTGQEDSHGRVPPFLNVTSSKTGRRAGA